MQRPLLTEAAGFEWIGDDGTSDVAKYAASSLALFGESNKLELRVGSLRGTLVMVCY